MIEEQKNYLMTKIFVMLCALATISQVNAQELQMDEIEDIQIEPITSESLEPIEAVVVTPEEMPSMDEQLSQTDEIVVETPEAEIQEIEVVEETNEMEISPDSEARPSKPPERIIQSENYIAETVELPDTDRPTANNAESEEMKTDTHNIYTWKDFQAGKPCQANEVFDEGNKEISNLIYSYCKSPNGDAWQKWMSTFREGKRTYLVQNTLKEKTKYVKYLKVVPHLLFDVYKKDARGNSITDQLDQIESLIAKRQTQKAVDLLQNLTDEKARQSLSPALVEGNHLLEIQEFLNNRSFEGGEND